MTAALLDEKTQPEAADDDAVRYACWSARSGAFALDVLPGVAVVAAMALLADSAPPDGC